MFFLVLALAGVIGVVVVLLRREQAENTRLRAGLDGAGARLQALQAAFGRFAPERLVDRIIEEGDIPTTGEKREVSVLFADLVGFTTVAEAVEPPVLLEILNGYFDAMDRAIRAHRGHVGTFLGDGVLALFGDFEANPWQQNDAAAAALAMRDALATYNEELARRSIAPLGIGIGLHSGIGIAGVVGSVDKKEFTVVGRTINVAARLQSYTRELGVDILVTGEFAEKLDTRFRLEDHGAAQLRGIDREVAVHALLGFREAGS